MPGAGASAVVPVRVAARVVAILVAEADVAAVVVVAAAPGETQNRRTKMPCPIHGTFPVSMFSALFLSGPYRLNPAADQSSDLDHLLRPYAIGVIR